MGKGSFSDEFLEWFFSAQSPDEIKYALSGRKLERQQSKLQQMRKRALNNFRIIFGDGRPNPSPTSRKKRAEQAFRIMFDPSRKYLYQFRRLRGKSPKWALEAQKRYYERHHDELLAKLREKRGKEKERYREYQRKWSTDKRSRNKHLRKYRRYYEKHRQQRIEYRKKYYEEHREEILRKKREKDRSKAPREIEPGVVATANSNDVL